MIQSRCTATHRITSLRFRCTMEAAGLHLSCSFSHERTSSAFVYKFFRLTAPTTSAPPSPSGLHPTAARPQIYRPRVPPVHRSPSRPPVGCPACMRAPARARAAADLNRLHDETFRGLLNELIGRLGSECRGGLGIAGGCR